MVARQHSLPTRSVSNVRPDEQIRTGVIAPSAQTRTNLSPALPRATFPIRSYPLVPDRPRLRPASRESVSPRTQSARSTLERSRAPLEQRHRPPRQDPASRDQPDRLPTLARSDRQIHPRHPHARRRLRGSVERREHVDLVSLFPRVLPAQNHRTARLDRNPLSAVVVRHFPTVHVGNALHPARRPQPLDDVALPAKTNRRRLRRHGAVLDVRRPDARRRDPHGRRRHALSVDPEARKTPEGPRASVCRSPLSSSPVRIAPTRSPAFSIRFRPVTTTTPTPFPATKPSTSIFTKTASRATPTGSAVRR